MGGPAIIQANVEYLEAIRTGRAMEPPGPLTAFYRETHLQNLRWHGPG
jgi:hypothetical protein